MQRFFLIIFCAIVIITTSSCDNDGIISPSDNIKSLPKLQLYADHDDYLHLLNNRSFNLDIPIDVFLDGKKYSGELRGAGAGSRYYPKWSYKAELNSGMINNVSEFNLSAQVLDPTLIKTTLVSHLYKELGFEVFESSHVFVSINDRDQGLYSFIERIEDDFFTKRNLSAYHLYKVVFEAKFTFEDINNPEFTFEKKIPEDMNFSTLENFIFALDTSNSENIRTSLGKFLDIDQYINYHAMTTILDNFDAFTNNFFLLKKSPTSPFEIVPWDFDKTLTGKNVSKLVGHNNIIAKIFENETTFEQYKQTVITQINNHFTEENLFPIIDSVAAVIKEGYNIDPYLGDGRYNLYTEIETLKRYIIQRRQYFIDNIESLEQDNFKN